MAKIRRREFFSSDAGEFVFELFNLNNAFFSPT